jgi:hypothetical protein
VAGQKTTLLVVIYDYVETGLWAVLAAGVAFFAIFVAPGLPEVQQRSEAERIAAFERQCEFYCTKWGLQHGTRPYSTCVSDLHQFRDALVTQLSGDSF